RRRSTVRLALALGSVLVWLVSLERLQGQGPTEAPTAFGDDNVLISNGFTHAAQFALDGQSFRTRQTLAGRLGPVYKARACADCHASPVTGAWSQVSEIRAGAWNGTNFVDHPGGSLIQERAIDPDFQELVFSEFPVRTFRASLNALGSGYVECIANDTL